jgi:L-glyceraldehyde 3-phosphate reductase
MAKGKFLKADRLTPEMMNYLQRLKQEAEAEGRTMAAHALRWVLQQQGVTSVLVGASSVEQLKTNLSAING